VTLRSDGDAKPGGVGAPRTPIDSDSVISVGQRLVMWGGHGSTGDQVENPVGQRVTLGRMSANNPQGRRDTDTSSGTRHYAVQAARGIAMILMPS
jgi:hypothetical protein